MSTPSAAAEAGAGGRLSSAAEQHSPRSAPHAAGDAMEAEGGAWGGIESPAMSVGGSSDADSGSDGDGDSEAEGDLDDAQPGSSDSESDSEDEGNVGLASADNTNLRGSLQIKPTLQPLIDALDAVPGRLLKCSGSEAAALLIERAAKLKQLGVDVELLQHRPNFDAQVSALLATLRGLLLKGETRGLVTMPCGTGKSFVMVWVVLGVHFFTNATDTLILAPSIHLIEQMLTNLREYSLPDGKLLRECFNIDVICSDRTIKRDFPSPEQLQRAAPEGANICDDPSKFAKVVSGRKDGKPRLLIATYHSCPEIEKAQRELKEQEGISHRFDLAMFDEAHHTTTGEGRMMSTAVEDKRISIVKRLHLTATPRMLRALGADADKRAKVFSMDDELLYGRNMYALEFREAIKAGMLCAPRFVLAGYDAGSTESAELQLLRAAVEKLGECSPEELASLHALLSAVLSPPSSAEPLRRKVLAFCSTLKDASLLAERLAAAAAAMGEELYAGFLSGEDSLEKRNKILETLRDSQATAIVCSARALQEGVDVPWCDTFAIMYSCRCSRTLVQMIGRATRLYGTKRCADVIIPVRNDDVGPVVLVVAAMAGVDSLVADLVRDLGGALLNAESAAALEERIDINTKALFSCNTDDLLDKVLGAVCENLSTKFDRKVYGGLVAHLERHPKDRQLQSVRKDTPHGRALFNLRAALARMGITELQPKRNSRIKAVKAALDAAFPGIDWTVQDDRWNEKWMKNYQWLKRYAARRNGDCEIPHSLTLDPGGDGSLKKHRDWAGYQRKKYHRKTLHANKVALLEEINFSWGNAPPVVRQCPISAWKDMCTKYSDAVNAGWIAPPRRFGEHTVRIPTGGTQEAKLYRSKLRSWADKQQRAYRAGKFAKTVPEPHTKLGTWCIKALAAIKDWKWVDAKSRSAKDTTVPCSEGDAAPVATPPVETATDVAALAASEAAQHHAAALEAPKAAEAGAAQEAAQRALEKAADAEEAERRVVDERSAKRPKPAEKEMADAQTQAAQIKARIAARRAAEETAATQAALQSAAEAVAAEKAAAEKAAKAAETERKRAILAAVLAAAGAAAPALPPLPLRGSNRHDGDRRKTDSGADWPVWDASHRFAGDGAGDAAGAAQLEAAARERDDIRNLRRVLKAAHDLKQNSAPARFSLMPHTIFTPESRWARQLMEDDVERLFPQAQQPAAADAAFSAGDPAATKPYRVVTFGVMHSSTRLRYEFDLDVPAAFGYGFDAREAKVLTCGAPIGEAAVDGCDVERELKALLKLAKKWHKHGLLARCALLGHGVAPFDHPACAVPDAAPVGIKDETVMLSEATWCKVNTFATTAELRDWLKVLSKSVDTAVRPLPAGAPRTQDPAAAGAGADDLTAAGSPDRLRDASAP